jgi:hypothetical protein
VKRAILSTEQPRGWAGAPAIGEPGRAATELPAGPPPGIAAADHELSACSLPGLEVRAASVRGLMHRYRGEPRQDRFSLVVSESGEHLVVTVCDGVGSLPLSHDAASFVAERTPYEYLDLGDWFKTVATVNQQLTRFAQDAPVGQGMATTFVAVSLNGQSGAASIAWTDDSSVWLLRDGVWSNLTPAVTRDEDPSLHTGRVRALPHRDPTVRVVDVTLDRGALFVMTDGVGVPLQGAGEVRDTLSAWWAGPPDVFTFGRQVGFNRKGHQDDRTVVGIWLTGSDER